MCESNNFLIFFCCPVIYLPVGYDVKNGCNNILNPLQVQLDIIHVHILEGGLAIGQNKL